MIIRLDHEQARQRALTGGKASALARLMAAGFAVPVGVVVTSPETGGDELRDAIGGLLADGHSLAVRSSGFAEDSSTASYAGQFETFLDVQSIDDAERAIARCFASFAGDRAGAYRSALEQRSAPGAVLVQRLVRATTAGVAFSQDPITGDPERIVIDAAAGLGEAVVSGRVTPDGFVVARSRDAIVERRIAGSRATLDDTQVRAVAKLALDVERHEGSPTDIEWAFEGNRLFLLQARPITTRAAERPADDWKPELDTQIDPRFPLYSSGNVGEILPGCVTPLTYSLFSRGVELAFRNLMESLGSMSDVGPRPIVLGFFHHRVYLNVSYFMAAADRSPGSSRSDVYEELIGPPPTRHPSFTSADLLPWNLWRGLRIVGRFLGMQGRLDDDIGATRKAFEDLASRFASCPPERWTNEELAAWVEVDDAGLQPGVVHIRASQFASTAFSALRKLSRTAANDSDGTLAATVVTGIGTITSADPAAALYAMGQIVREDAQLSTLFASVSDDDALLAAIDASKTPAGDRLRQALRAFAAKHGHRGLRETDFRSPNWREGPAQVLANVRHHLSPGDMSPAELAARQAQRSEQARAQLIAAMPRWRQGYARAIIDSARKHIAARETTKDLALRFVDLTRRVIAEGTRRIGDRIGVADDVHFLLGAELATALRGRMGADEIATIVKRRRRDFAWSERVAAPKVRDGSRTGSFADASPAVSNGSTLRGVAVSPGVIEGRARVVLNPSLSSLESGDVLVAPVTDVAWTPLFLRASALVVEVGGPLSHGSIVAREFGLPAVTAVAGATTSIRDGDRVRVDGGRGTVSIVERAV